MKCSSSRTYCTRGQEPRVLAHLGARPLPALLGLFNVRAKSCQAVPGQGPSLAVLCCSHWARAGQARIPRGCLCTSRLGQSSNLQPSAGAEEGFQLF